MEFEEACSEMCYILENLNPIDKKKIPEATLQFFNNNKSIFYKVNLDVNKELREQNLKDETKAFIQIINKKYFNGEYFFSEEKEENFENKECIKENTELIVRKKENKIIAFFKNILKKFKL